MHAFTSVACRKFHLEELSWNFFASSHGKGVIDGLGGTLKRYVWRRVKSRQAVVRNPREFFNVARECNVTCTFLSKEEIAEKFAQHYSMLLEVPMVVVF
jgi:hypothetical protein